MHFDFSSLGRTARSMIPVPDVPIEAMRARVRRATTQGRLRTLAVGGAICIAALGVGAGFGGRIYDSVHVWLTGEKATTSSHSFVEVREPTAADLRGIISRATFPLVLPTGIPAGTRVTIILYFPVDHPDFVQIQYYNKHPKMNVGISLYSSAAINTNAPGPISQAYREDVYRWRVGAEYVIIPKAHVSPREAARVKAAMMINVSPMSSFSATKKMLRFIDNVSGDPEIADIAERYAPATGLSVLLGPLQVRSLPDHSQNHEPLTYSRRTEFGPDMRSTGRRFKGIVLPLSGVNALNAVLRFAGVHNGFLLYNQPMAMKYWVWTIPSNGSSKNIRKYSVDAKTLLVTPSA